MPYRCKLVAKQNLLGNKIKKGDVITFVTQSNSRPSFQQMGEAIANYLGESDWRRIQTAAQYHQYDISFEIMR